MTIQDQLAALEVHAGVIDPKGHLRRDIDECGTIVYVFLGTPIDQSLALDKRIGQAWRGIEKWCTEHDHAWDILIDNGEYTIRAWDDLTYDTMEPNPTAKVTGPSLAHALAAAIETLNLSTSSYKPDNLETKP